MEKNRARANEVVEKAGEARASLKSITEALGHIVNMNAQIASAAQQQGFVSEDISKSAERIRELTDQAASSAEQTSSSSTELAKMGEDLRGLVSSFRV